MDRKARSVTMCLYVLALAVHLWGMGEGEHTSPLQTEFVDHLYGEEREAGGDGKASEC